MRKKEVILEGSLMRSMRDFHFQISRGMGFSDFYGANLDALWDSMSGHADTNVILRWKDADRAKDKLGSDFDTIVGIFNDTKELWPQFEYILE